MARRSQHASDRLTRCIRIGDVEIDLTLPDDEMKQKAIRALMGIQGPEQQRRAEELVALAGIGELPDVFKSIDFDLRAASFRAYGGG